MPCERLDPAPPNSDSDSDRNECLGRCSSVHVLSVTEDPDDLEQDETFYSYLPS